MGIRNTLQAALLILLLATMAAAQVGMVPGSSSRGAKLFVDKGCVNCHSFSGTGGTAAPDLAQRSERSYSPDLLASVMWNHGPAMWAAFKEKSTPIPDLSAADVSDLYAYFYSILYFRAAGDAARGKAVFEQKGCGRCHSGSKTGIEAGPLVSQWSHVKDPLNWAERMWNHSGPMQVAMTKAGMKWPQLTTQNTVDLITYLQGLARSETAQFQPGDPERGKITFAGKCESCHAFGTAAPGQVDLAARRSAPRNLTDYITTMWNHAPLMRKMAPAALPKLDTGEMANLVAFMFAQRYFFNEGDVSRGQAVYQKKGCADCHDRRRDELRVPDLGKSSERFSPLTMTVAVWRHGRSMMEILNREGKAWPQFSGPEMTNMIAFLNSRRAKGNGAAIER